MRLVFGTARKDVEKKERCFFYIAAGPVAKCDVFRNPDGSSRVGLKG